MGLVSGHVFFEGPSPELSRIADRISELCGQPVCATGSDEAVKGDLFDLHARLAFASEPSQQLEVYSYRPGAVRRFNDEALRDTGVWLPVQGLNEPPGSQVVYLRSHVGPDPTLLVVTLLALEALGGTLGRPLSAEERQKYGRLMTAEELRGRHRAAARRGRAALAVGVLLAPILMAFTAIQFVVTAPYLLWRGIRDRRRQGEGHTKA